MAANLLNANPATPPATPPPATPPPAGGAMNDTVQSMNSPYDYRSLPQPIGQFMDSLPTGAASRYQGIFGFLNGLAQPQLNALNEQQAFINGQGGSIDLTRQLTGTNQDAFRNSNRADYDRNQNNLALAQAYLGQQGFNQRQFDLASQLAMVNNINRVGQASAEFGAAGAMQTPGARNQFGGVGAPKGSLAAQAGLPQKGLLQQTFENEQGTAQLSKDAADKEKGTLAANYGITANELDKALTLGIQKLGLEGNLSVNSLLMDSAGIDAKRAGIAQDVIEKAVQLGLQGGGLPGLGGQTQPPATDQQKQQMGDAQSINDIGTAPVAGLIPGGPTALPYAIGSIPSQPRKPSYFWSGGKQYVNKPGPGGGYMPAVPTGKTRKK